MGFFGYDLVRAVEPLGEPAARPARPARHGADALRRARRLRPPQAHGHDPRQRRPAGRARRRARLRRGRRARSSEVRDALAGPVPRGEPRAPAAARDARVPAPTCRASTSKRWWRGSSSYIYAGDAFQVVPSQRWSAPVPVEAFSIYRGLRAVNPSPYMYFLDFGDFQVAGASPEPLLTVSGRHVSHQADRRHPPARRDARGGPADRRRAAGRREGARRARDARGPRPQRPRPRVRVRQRGTSTS